MNTGRVSVMYGVCALHHSCCSYKIIRRQARN